MRIGIVGTIWQSIPPQGYGGTEQVIYNLANGLKDAGHDVTLFAPATTKTKAQLSPTVTHPLREKNISWEEIPYNIYHISQAYERAKEFDILHVHLNKAQDYMALPWSLVSPTPIVVTPHFNIESHRYKKSRYPLLLKYQYLPYTSISYAQRGNTPLNFIENVYNSLDIADYPFIKVPDDYYMWLGKIIPHKGAKEAILAAKNANVKLILAGIIDEDVPESVSYFKDELRPYIDNKQIIFHGPTKLPEKARLLGHAKALINSYQWEEPFGLVSIEAQACGTPVIITNRGAAKETIIDKKTGFLSNSIADIAEKIHEINQLKRLDCRHFVEEAFTNSRMVEGYLTAYKATIEHWNTYVLAQREWLKTYKDKPVEVGKLLG